MFSIVTAIVIANKIINSKAGRHRQSCSCLTSVTDRYSCFKQVHINRWVTKFQRSILSSLGQKRRYICWSSMLQLIWNKQAQGRLISARFISFLKKPAKCSNPARENIFHLATEPTREVRQILERVMIISKAIKPVFWCDISSTATKNTHTHSKGISSLGKYRKSFGLFLVASRGLITAVWKTPQSHWVH